MTTKPSRIIDPHIHLWDPERVDWYPYLSGGKPEHAQAMARMNRRFDAATYRAESAGWNVEQVVNVAAATGGHSVDETLALDALAEAEGFPHAIVGGLPPTDTVDEAIALLDRQLASPRFRGVRLMGPGAGPLPSPEVLRALADRGLVLDLMAHPDQLLPAAAGLAGFDDLVVAVEHCGWPRSDAADERRLWDEGMVALAALGDHVVCKLSGLTMPFRTMRPDVVTPWIERAIDLFGPERAMFASNFPVDSVGGTFDDLYTTFSTITEALDEPARDHLFAGTAERTYRL